MNDPLWAVTIIASVLLFGILLFFVLDKLERWSEKKQQMEMRREAQRQRETLEIVREVGKQMLGTLRPGEVDGPATEEERIESPVDGSTAWWTGPGDMTDPTDNELPDPGQFVDPTDLSDPGEQNLGDDLPTATAFPTSTKPMPAVVRFEAVIVEAKLTQKGEWALTLKIPWSDRDSAVELADKHGVMLDWRVSSKPGG